jgi:hypothetical protein
VSRQFTDGEISAEIGRIATEGGTLSRTVVRKRLGGGSSSRIDALLKEYRRNGAGPSNGAGRLPAEVALPRTISNPANPRAEPTKGTAAWRPSKRFRARLRHTGRHQEDAPDGAGRRNASVSRQRRIRLARPPPTQSRLTPNWLKQTRF